MSINPTTYNRKTMHSWDCANCNQDLVSHDPKGVCPSLPVGEHSGPFDEVTPAERAEWKAKEDAWRLYNARLQFACANRIAFPNLPSASVMHRANDDAKAFMEKCGG